MAIRSIAQLKAWFSRGQYPVESQFADWLDSFFHKSEPIPLGAVDGLHDMLNAKYDAEKAKRLETAIGEAILKVGDLEGDVNNAFESIAEVENRIENDCIQKTTRLILSGGSPADLVNNA